MQWWDGLDPEVLQRLRDRYPDMTLNQIAVEAMRRKPKEFAEIGAMLVWKPNQVRVVPSGERDDQ